MSGEKIDLGFFGKTLKEGLLSILEKWRPPSMKTELEYRNALIERLRKFLPEYAKVEKEYRHGGTTTYRNTQRSRRSTVTAERPLICTSIRSIAFDYWDVFFGHLGHKRYESSSGGAV